MGKKRDLKRRCWLGHASLGDEELAIGSFHIDVAGLVRTTVHPAGRPARLALLNGAFERGLARSIGRKHGDIGTSAPLKVLTALATFSELFFGLHLGSNRFLSCRAALWSRDAGIGSALERGRRIEDSRQLISLSALKSNSPLLRQICRSYSWVVYT